MIDNIGIFSIVFSVNHSKKKSWINISKLLKPFMNVSFWAHLLSKLHFSLLLEWKKQFWEVPMIYKF